MNGTDVYSLDLTGVIGKRACARCEFVFQQAHQGGQVEFSCRRNPPFASVLMVPAPPPRVGQMMPTVLSAFAVVQPDHWCGEFRVAPVKPPI